MRDAQKHKAALVVYSLSRMARSLKDSITIVEELKQAGAAFVSLTEDFDTTSANGDFVFNIMASVAQLERKQTGERTKAAMAQLKKQGRRVSGRIPYGYDLLRDRKHLIRNEREQEVIRLMRQFRREGLSYRAIAAELNKCKIPSKLGKRWTAQAVRRIIIAHE